jgi:ferredoxin-NADP reductase
MSTVSATDGRTMARLHSITLEAENIWSFEFRPTANDAFLPFTAGAHIDVHLANGMVRSYSLINPQDEHHRYVIAVSRDANGRGGSRYMFESLQVGTVLELGAPRNNFPLVEDASLVVFIAGGIGITPIVAMIRRLQDLKRNWKLFYVARTRRHCAFIDELESLPEAVRQNVHLFFDQEPDGRSLDLPAALESVPADAHVYCCGPTPMLVDFQKLAAGMPSAQVHVEFFRPPEMKKSQGEFSVVLSRSGRCIAVSEGKTILDALADAGVRVPFSCMEGICGSCETVVLDGVPDHRDFVLSESEKAENRKIILCCSGARSKTLVLDL